MTTDVGNVTSKAQECNRNFGVARQPATCRLKEQEKYLFGAQLGSLLFSAKERAKVEDLGTPAFVKLATLF